MLDPAIIVFIVFSSIATVAIIIGVLIFFAKRLEHKQIMAAIEKGTPLSDLKRTKPEPVGPVWIKYLTGGITLFFIGLAFMAAGSGIMGIRGLGSFVAFILCGIGIAWLVRGLLCRKYEIQNRLSATDNNTEYKKPISVSAPEISNQSGE